MNSSHSLKKLLVVGALALGLAGAAFAGGGEMTAADAPSLVGQGLLGQTYAHASYGFLDLDNTGVDAHALNFEYNRAVDERLDTWAGARFLRTGTLPGGRYSEQALSFGGRTYTLLGGVKTFWDAGLGWTWAKGPGGFRDNTFAWSSSVGAEVTFTNGVTLTPYLQYADAIDFADGDSWNVGVKGNYWLNSRTAILAGVERQIEESWEYRVGVNYRF